ncbi:MAG: hypothetical protein LPK00_03050 [Bacillaceae bacterium]|nr:hypothetical protein [Bacillaceae bacterium]
MRRDYNKIEIIEIVYGEENPVDILAEWFVEYVNKKYARTVIRLKLDKEDEN